MATAEVFSTTPQHSTARNVYDMSSSPLPSPSQIVQKRSATLRTGSNAVSTPKDACTTFTSASALLRRSLDDHMYNMNAIRSFTSDNSGFKSKNTSSSNLKAGKATKNSGADTSAGVEKPKRPRAKVTDSRKKKADGEEGIGVEKAKAPRKPRAKKADTGVSTDRPGKEKVARKPRTKNVEGDTQIRLGNNQVTKNLVTSDAEETVYQLKKTSRRKKSSTSALDDQSGDNKGYGLEEAVKRRTKWTPPSATAKALLMTAGFSSDLLEEDSLSTEVDPSEEKSKGLGNILGNFGFISKDCPAAEKRVIDGSGTRKRKLIELVKTSVSGSTVETPKEKTLKKKARTLTDLATSAFAEAEEEPAKPAPLLQYFSYKDGIQKTKDGFRVPPRPKKGSAAKPVLLSPESAMKQVDKQDFVFGTSSQLAREESPTLLRDLHETMKVSNEYVDPFDDPFASPVPHSTTLSTEQEKSKSMAKRNLWSAASRDDDGNLLEVEMVDLADSPALANQPKSLSTSIALLEDIDNEEVWHEIEDSPLPPLLKQQEPIAKHNSPTGPEDGMLTELELNSSSTRTQSITQQSLPISQSSKYFEAPKAAFHETKGAAKAVQSRQHLKQSEKPNYASFTTVQLAKEIASYRFKPIKSRDSMIAMLEKCWEGKQRTALGALTTNVTQPCSASQISIAQPYSTQASPSNEKAVKRPRGRPKKDGTATSSPKATKSPGTRGRPRKDGTAPSSSPKAKTKVSRTQKSNTVEYLEMDSDAPLTMVRTPKKSQKKAKQLDEDISDSDGPFTPSPPRRHPSDPQRSVPSFQLAIDGDESTELELSPSSAQKLVFKHITQAVMDMPPSKDSQNPSWYEKILLYDPIILEDLTIWLNTGALGKNGWDGEVEPKQVKKWCESKSICCLWRENLRGGARNRY